MTLQVALPVSCQQWQMVRSQQHAFGSRLVTFTSNSNNLLMASTPCGCFTCFSYASKVVSKDIPQYYNWGSFITNSLFVYFLLCKIISFFCPLIRILRSLDILWRSERNLHDWYPSRFEDSENSHYQSLRMAGNEIWKTELPSDPIAWLAIYVLGSHEIPNWRFSRRVPIARMHYWSHVT